MDRRWEQTLGILTRKQIVLESPVWVSRLDARILLSTFMFTNTFVTRINPWSILLNTAVYKCVLSEWPVPPPPSISLALHWLVHYCNHVLLLYNVPFFINMFASTCPDESSKSIKQSAELQQDNRLSEVNTTTALEQQWCLHQLGVMPQSA